MNRQVEALMGMIRHAVFFFALVVSTFGADLLIESPPTRCHLIELYTSEGCSSCPPADAWLRGLKSERGLWREFVPIAFHVTYWDDLGWPDRLASPRFTQRQRDYAAAWGSGSVYTPGFVLDGREWAGRALPRVAAERVGRLSLRVSGSAVSVLFERDDRGGKDLTANLAWLGGELVSDVRAGENRGRTLRHEFVALSLHAQSMGLTAAGATASFPGPRPSAAGSLAVWIVESGRTEPIQAAGGWLRAP